MNEGKQRSDSKESKASKDVNNEDGDEVDSIQEVESCDKMMSPISKLEYKALVSRRRRRKLRKTTEIFNIDGSWSDISRNFQELYNSLLLAKTDCFECYQIILNSLESFYQRTTASNSDESEIRRLVSTFLEKFFSSILVDEIILNRAICTEKHMMECELRCLLEIHLLRVFPRPLSRTNIVQKLRYLFFASGSERIKKFLNETICDEFFEDLPLSLAGIYEELFLDAPVDLQRFQSQEQIERSKPQPVQVLREKNKFASKLLEFMNECEEDAEDEAKDFAAKIPKRKNKRTGIINASKEKSAKRRKRHMSSTVSPDPAYEKRPQARRRLLHVPETPDEKLLQSSQLGQSPGQKMDDEGMEVVPNTPIGKIRKTLGDKSNIAPLVKKEEERLMQIDLSAKASRRKQSCSFTQPVELPKDIAGHNVTITSNKTMSTKGSISTGSMFNSRSMLNASIAGSVARRKARRKIEFDGFSGLDNKEPEDEAKKF